MPLKKKKGSKAKTRRMSPERKNALLKKRYGPDIRWRVYDLAKQGLSERAISEALNIPRITLRGWEDSDCIIGAAMRAGRKYMGDGETPFAFRDYVFDRLPDYLRDVWDTINECEESSSSIAAIEALSAHQGKTARQHLFSYAYVHFGFCVNKALAHLSIPSSTYRYWTEEDDDFMQLMQEIHFHKKNFYEDALTQLVANGHPHATIFVNKTINKDRGYGNESKVNVSIQGEIRHSVDMVNIEELNLDLSMRKALLVKIREAKNANELETIEVKAISSVLSGED